MTEKEFAELAAGYALHALSTDDERAFLAARAQHPEWEHHVASDETVAAALADGVGDVAPPAALRADLLARIGEVPQTPAPAPVRARRRKPGVRSLFALAASIALLLGVGAVATIVTQQVDRPAAVIALDRIESAPDAQRASASLPGGGEATVHWSESAGDVVLVSRGLPPIEPDQSYELWFVRGDEPISAGVFDAGEGGTAAALLSGEMSPGDVIAVTVEPAGGSPTGVPTSAPILAIPTA